VQLQLVFVLRLRLLRQRLPLLTLRVAAHQWFKTFTKGKLLF
jgi:hypothetical protein